MASIVKLGKGKQPPRAIDFMGLEGRRHRIRLGIVTHADAEVAKRRIERLIACRKLGQELDNQLLEWLAGLADEIHARVARFGLCESRDELNAGQIVNLGDFLESYISGRSIHKANTRRNYEVTRRHLVGYFGNDRKLTDITPGDADDWQESLRKKLSAATVSREAKRARQFFRAAQRKRFIDENPFADLSTPAQVNSSREYYVDQETIEKVIASCPDAQWRLIVALSRYGGLRCPSEHLRLTWGDVDWEHERITIRSPKTEHHVGGESRVLPLFPELRPYLEAVFDEAESGTEYVITRYRKQNANLRSLLLRIIKRAGVKAWPKLFHNLRASRQTELTGHFPLHVVCEWIGNSALIASKHYLQVTDDHYAEAVEGAAESAADVQQKAQQQIPAPNCKVMQQSSEHNKKARENRAQGASEQHAASTCHSVPKGIKYPLGESNYYAISRGTAQTPLN